MRKIRTIAVIAFMALALQASAKDPKWLKSVRNSVFNVVAYDTDGRELSRSRGFFISTDGTGITDRSVLVGADKAVTIDAAGTTRQIQVVTGADDIYDAVRFSLQPDKKLTAVQLSKVQALEGGQVFILTLSSDGKTALKPTSVSKTMKIDGDRFYYNLSLPFDSAYTGCPVFDDDGHFVGEVCPAYAFCDDTVFLQGDNLYSFGFPYLYRFDRRGENKKIICEVDMPQPIIWQVMFSKTDVYVLYYYFLEYEQTTDSGGNIIWLPGEPRDDRITGILHISLVDGSYEDITPESDCKYRDVLNFRVEDDGLYFYYCDTDEDALVTNDMKTDSERYAWRAEHQWHTVYYYNAKTKDTSTILCKKGTWDYSFGNGFIIEKEGRIGTDRRIVFLNLDGTMIRELEKDRRFITSVNSDKDLIYAYGASETGSHVYSLCNFTTGEVERQVTVPYTFIVYAAAGDSYYGMDSDSPYGFGFAILFWISKEDFWAGNLDRAVYFPPNK